MPVDPQIQTLIDGMSEGEVPEFAELGHIAVREMCESMLLPFEAGELANVEDRTIYANAADLAVRVYQPENPQQKKLPLVVYYHGGGWTIGSLNTHDPICRALAAWSGCVVVSVDYRLAPEHPFPVPLEDSYAALVYLAEHAGDFGADGNRVAVAGDSAGGNLAAEMCLLARDRNGPVVSYQLLFYPITDANFTTASYNDNAQGYVLRKSDMQWFWNQYIAEANKRSDPFASPLQAELHDLPAACVVTAQYDTLRDEGDAYAEKLRAAGVAVEHIECVGMVHGFIGFAALVDKGRDVLKDCAQRLARALFV